MREGDGSLLSLPGIQLPLNKPNCFTETIIRNISFVFDLK